MKGDSVTVITNLFKITALPAIALVGSTSAHASLIGDSILPSGGQMTVALETEIIPEPASLTVLGLGVPGLAALLYRRKKR